MAIRFCYKITPDFDASDPIPSADEIRKDILDTLLCRIDAHCQTLDVLGSCFFQDPDFGGTRPIASVFEVLFEHAKLIKAEINAAYCADGLRESAIGDSSRTEEDKK